jgi:hypothetical protein
LLPQDHHIVELGFSWFPSDRLIFNACLGVERGDYHTTQFGTGLSFDEENYPMTFNVWYAASDRWSMSVGYSVYSNFVGQDISVADQVPYYQTSAGPPPVYSNALPPITSRWNYGGQAHVVTLGSRYALTERVSLTGKFEWVYGHDLVYNSQITGVTLTPEVGTYSEVLNETTRVTLGADWKIRPRVVVYGRYELFNFSEGDLAPGNQTGLAQGVLGGFSALF